MKCVPLSRLTALFLLSLGIAPATLQSEEEPPRKVIAPGGRETLTALPARDQTTPEAAPAPTTIAPTVVPASRVPTSGEVAAEDRAFLETQAPAETGEPAAPRQEPPVTGEPLLAGGPYESAPPDLQAEVFRRAESVLRRQGLLEEEPEAGVPSEALLEEALFRYQSAERIPLTGRLDTTTLITMRLMPREGEWSGDVEEGARPVEVFRGRTPRSSRELPPNVVRGIPLD